MIYTCNSFTGRWSVPVAAVVEADTKEDAAEILNAELKNIGLRGDAKVSSMVEFTGGLAILSDGDY